MVIVATSGGAITDLPVRVSTPAVRDSRTGQAADVATTSDEAGNCHPASGESGYEAARGSTVAELARRIPPPAVHGSARGESARVPASRGEARELQPASSSDGNRGTPA